MENQETQENKSEVIQIPKVNINISKSEAGDLTVVSLVAEKPMTEKQLSMVLHALADKVMEAEDGNQTAG